MIGCCVYEYVTEFVINNYKLVTLAKWFVTILIIFEVVEQSTRIAPPTTHNNKRASDSGQVGCLAS